MTASEGTGPEGPGRPPLRVIKFGGAALERPREAVALVRNRRRGGSPVVVVVSARAGVTDELLELQEPSRPAAARAFGLAAIERQYPDPDPETRTLLAEVERGAARAPALPPPAERARFLALGERLAARWFALRLQSVGVPAVPLDADRIGLEVGGSPLEGEVLLDGSRAAVRGALLSALARGSVPVVTGFFGRGTDGRVHLLGRGGSDTTATALGALLDAVEVELVKNDGPIRTADPRLVPEARAIRELSYEDAERIAAAGARVLHRAAIAPARTSGRPVRVVSFADRGLYTLIHSGAPPVGAVVLGPSEPVPSGDDPSGAAFTVALSVVGNGLPTLGEAAGWPFLAHASEVKRSDRVLELRVPREEGLASLRALHRALVEETHGASPRLGRAPSSEPTLPAEP
jgi:aspartate kinase